MLLSTEDQLEQVYEELLSLQISVTKLGEVISTIVKEEHRKQKKQCQEIQFNTANQHYVNFKHEYSSMIKKNEKLDKEIKSLQLRVEESISSLGSAQNVF
jgi:IS30 family transposase